MRTKRLYPGRLTREQWLKLPIWRRTQLAARARSDLLGLWRTCSKKPCRRAHGCCGDERCALRPYQADFKNPNFGRPDFVCSFRYPDHLHMPRAILDQLPFMVAPATPEEFMQACAAQVSADAAAALRLVFRLQRRRGPRAEANT